MPYSPRKPVQIVNPLTGIQSPPTGPPPDSAKPTQAPSPAILPRFSLTVLVVGLLLATAPWGWAADENWTRQGEILLGMGRYEEAARMFSQAIEVEGIRPEILLGRGLARLYAGQLEIAEEDLTRVIEMVPQNPKAFTARGTVRFELGQYGAAIEDYTRALAVDQSYAPAYNQLGWALAVVSDAKLRNPERALEMARKAVDLDPSIHHQDTLAAALAASEKFTQAAVVQKEVLRRAIQDDLTDELEAYSARLRRYESGEPWRLDTSQKAEKPTALAARPPDAVKSAPPSQPEPPPPLKPPAAPPEAEAKPEVPVKTPAAPPEAEAKPEVPVKTPAVPPKPAEPPPPAPAPEAPAPRGASSEPAPESEAAAANSSPAQPPEVSAPPPPETAAPEAPPSPAPLPPAPLPPAQPQPLPYTIQVSSYPEHLRSHGIALDLRDKGDLAFTAPTQIPGKGLWHRVFIGHFNQISQARAAAEQLKSRNFRRADIVVKPFALQLGRSDSPLELDHLEAQLGRLGYLLYRLPDPDQPEMTRLLMGAYGTEPEALPSARVLQEKGFKPKIVAR